VQEKLTITEKLEQCRKLLDQAEEYAYDGFYDESNSTWSRAAEIAIQLIRDNSEDLFLEQEYRFLKTIINHITEED
jgi:hypothetical protein